ncbi:hypothetical protein CPJCM30710_26730 [Clostridium polyendosporum]|uniref:Uncharacterized protein n=1 Tax=Clostridium polyendosporum TaxID=69208 RepID=A0A919S1D2_9CLOT|nr:hypothetical protein [Clostridium polyendosporum]GIM30007.1 hypothetical protein CPJCM30710_26730 [Clostridium polyendosporum]
MNEKLIKKFIKYKLSVVGKIVDRLPLKMSKELKNLGLIIIESINESSQKTKERPASKLKSSDKLNNITIE